MDNMYLQHMTPEEKAEYNRQYYQKHKYDIWGIKRGNSAPILNTGVQRPIKIAGSGGVRTAGNNPYRKNDVGNRERKKIYQLNTNPFNFRDGSRANLTVRENAKYLYPSSSQYAAIASNNAKTKAEELRRASYETYPPTGSVKKDIIALKYSKIDEYKRRTKAHLDSFGKAWKSGANDLINAGKSIWNKLFG